MSTNKSIKSLLPQEWTLAVILVVCTLLFPNAKDWTINLHCNSIIAFLILLLSLQNIFSKTLIIPKDYYTLAFLTFPILNCLSCFWANNISLVWDKSAMWFVLFCFYINLRSIDVALLNVKFWKGIVISILVVNLIFISYSFWIASYVDGNFSLSYDSISQSHLIFGTNGNYITSMLVLWVPINIYLALQKQKLQLLYIFLLLVTIFIILFYNSRASTIALVLVLFTAGAYHFKQHNSFKGIISIGMLLFVFFAFVLLFMEDSSLFFEQYNPLRTILKNTGDDRIEIWKWTLELYKKHPFLGAGSGNWINEIKQFGANDYNNYRSYTHAHNLFLETLAELGIFGLINILLLFLAPILLFFADLQHKPIHFYLILSICSFIVVNMFYGIIYIPLNLRCVWIFLICWLFAQRKKKTYYFAYLLLPFLIFANIYIFYKENADSKIKQFHKVLGKDKTAANQIIDDIYFPGIYEFHLKRNLLFLKEKASIDPNVSIKLLQQGLAKSPYDEEGLYSLGQKYAASKKFDEALKVFKKALSLNERHFPSAIAILEIGNQKKYWDEFEFGATIFEEHAIPHKEKYFDADKIKKESAFVKRYWYIRNRYIKQYEGLLRERKEKDKIN